MAISRNKKFGIQTAIRGLRPPLIANVAEMVSNKIYEKLNAKPIPRFIPIPPFTFLLAKANPIVVRIKAANG
jgi:hypothetical protein